MSAFDLLDPWETLNIQLDHVTAMLSMFSESYLDQSPTDTIVRLEAMNSAFLAIYDYFRIIKAESNTAFQTAFDVLVRNTPHKGENAA